MHIICTFLPEKFVIDLELMQLLMLHVVTDRLEVWLDTGLV